MQNSPPWQYSSPVNRKKWINALFKIDWQSLTAIGLPFLLYSLTLAPSIYNLDSAELTTAAYTGGVMRATGYPLYLTLGSVWSRIPLGDVGYRMNLLSAVFGALTILLASRILMYLNTPFWAIFGSLGLLATSTFFWGLSLVAEVYTLHTAIMGGLIYCLLRWGDLPSPSHLFWVGLMVGLGAAHHAAIILLMPGSVLYLLVAHPKQALTPKSLLGGLLGTLIGLSFFVYLPLRYLSSPTFNYAGTYDINLIFHPVDLSTLRGLWWLVSGRAFSGAMLEYHGIALWHEVQDFLIQLGQAFFAIGVGPGILGAVVLFKKNWRQAVMLAAMFICSAGFYIDYRVLDKDTMFLPAYLIWALWAGIGYQQLMDWALQAEPQIMRRAIRIALPVFAASAVLAALTWNWHIVDLSGDWTTRQRGEAIFQSVEPNAVVFGWWDTVPVLQYLQLVEGQRPDVLAVNRFLLAPDSLETIIAKEVYYRPIYIDSLTDQLSAVRASKINSPVYRLLPR